jgi:hypothetical protein
MSSERDFISKCPIGQGDCDLFVYPFFDLQNNEGKRPPGSLFTCIQYNYVQPG